MAYNGLDATDDLTSSAADIKKAGYSWVARYYFNTSAFKHQLTHTEAVALSKAGLYVVAVYESGMPTSAAYFNSTKGTFDLGIARKRAQETQQPKGTPIYFAVDYDASTADLAAITAYFKELQSLRPDYQIGVYASGLVCKHLKDLGLVDKTWLSQSKGFSGYSSWLAHADIVQGPETHVLGKDVDLDLSHGSAGGWKILS